jgi:protein-L-isoaspartate(D-aspartate) O-methyltransferase
MVMIDYPLLRKNMVDCQLTTNGIVDPDVLNAFANLPREKFLADQYKCAAYVDEDLNLGNGEFLLDPLTQARMIQAANIKPDEVILNLGDSTGYSSAILSAMASTVVTLESRIGSLDRARKVWADLDLCNIAVLKGNIETGCLEHGPYTLILINGAVREISGKLLWQIYAGGRLISVVRKPEQNFGRITMIRRSRDSQYSTVELFDANTPFIQEVAQESVFCF